MKRVTGIGGIFFKCKDTRQTRDWYAKHLGLETDDYGTSFEWFQGADPSKKGFTAWSPFGKETTYFGESGQDYMVNYRVGDLETLVKILKAEGVKIVDSIETYEYGKFIHIEDPEGRRIELWEANDEEYDKMVQARTK